MAVPNIFEAGDVARSAELNENFDYIMSIIGHLSTPGRIDKLTEFTMGPRKTFLMTSTQDDGVNGYEFGQFSWNADYNYVSSDWRYSRVVNNRPATAVRIGRDGFEVWTTSATDGPLNAQMTRVFAIKATKEEDRIYFPDTWHFQNYNAQGRSIQDYRLMHVLMDNPQAIYNNSAINASTSPDLTASNYGVPKAAKAISIRVASRAFNDALAEIEFHQKGTATNSRDKGFKVIANAGQYNTGWGVVPLGHGANAGKFTARATRHQSITAFVTGYWT